MMTPTPRVPRRLAAQRGPPPLARVMSIRCVQADHNSCGCDTDHPVPESHLLRPIEGDEAGYFRFQEADRLSGMDDLVRYRLRDRLLGRKTDLRLLELTPGPASRTPRPFILSCGRPWLSAMPSGGATSSCSYRRAGDVL